MFLENHQKPWGNGDRFLKRTMAEKNGESTARILWVVAKSQEIAPQDVKPGNETRLFVDIFAGIDSFQGF